jgi:hypothetical protein
MTAARGKPPTITAADGSAGKGAIAAAEVSPCGGLGAASFDAGSPHNPSLPVASGWVCGHLAASMRKETACAHNLGEK